MEIVSLVEQGDDVFVQWHLSGTHEGTLLGIEPTGKRLAIDGIDHFVVRDSNAVELRHGRPARPPARSA